MKFWHLVFIAILSIGTSIGLITGKIPLWIAGGVLLGELAYVSRKVKES